MLSGLSGGTGSTTSITDKQVFGASVVSGTMDKLNTNLNGTTVTTDTDYQFQKDVLSGLGIGKTLDVSV
jgi:hypothetical protein